MTGWISPEKRTLTGFRNLRFIVRPDHLTDLTAVFGRIQEQEVESLIKKIPTDAIFVDAGAHIGRYTLLASKTIGNKGTVLAIEPEPENFKILSQNCRINELHNIRLEQYALGNCNGIIDLFSGLDAATNTISKQWHIIIDKHQRDPVRVSSVPLIQLDDLLSIHKISRVHLLKIDVEGAELMVLEGLSGFLEKKAIDAIICEVHSPVVKMSEVVHLLTNYGYTTKEIGEAELYAEK